MNAPGMPFMAKSPSGNAETFHGPEAGSQSFKRGGPVKWSSGKIAARTDDSTDKLLGFAKIDAAGVVNTDIEIDAALPGKEFVLSASHATPASAVFAQTDVGGVFAIQTESNGRASIDIANSTDGQKCLVMTRLFDAAGTVYGRAYFVVRNGFSDFDA